MGAHGRAQPRSGIAYPAAITDLGGSGADPAGTGVIHGADVVVVARQRVVGENAGAGHRVARVGRAEVVVVAHLGGVGNNAVRRVAGIGGAGIVVVDHHRGVDA